jgi:hypothetical protein
VLDGLSLEPDVRDFIVIGDGDDRKSSLLVVGRFTVGLIQFAALSLTLCRERAV